MQIAKGGLGAPLFLTYGNVMHTGKYMYLYTVSGFRVVWLQLAGIGHGLAQPPVAGASPVKN